MIGPDGVRTNVSKGRIWKAAHHEGRALLKVTQRLHELAEGAAQ